MKALLINTSDSKGGAARAAYRLHKGLLSIGVDSRMLVQNKSTTDPTIIGPQTKFARRLQYLRRELDRVPLLFYPKRARTAFWCQWFPSNVPALVDRLAPDIVHLHWISGGFVNIESLKKLRRPIVWTLHDMWAFTGGCHYSGDCTKYELSCGQCPYLRSPRAMDLSRWIWSRKRKAYAASDITIVTPSKWLARCARESSLLRTCRIEVIPNGIDTEQFRPIRKETARKTLQLPLDKTIVMFGAEHATKDTRKGFDLLRSALGLFQKDPHSRSAEVVVFGGSEPQNLQDYGVRTRYLGRHNDDTTLALLYSAADVFVAPSIQDNLPNTVLESMACGTPVVAFNIGGMPDLIEHRLSGYLAPPFEPRGIAEGIGWVIEEQDRNRLMGERARQRVLAAFTQEAQARAYRDLYLELIETHVAGGRITS